MKRRRLNDNSAILSKPFKSPLLMKPTPKPTDQPKSDDAKEAESQDDKAQSIRPPSASPTKPTGLESTNATPPRSISLRSSPKSSPLINSISKSSPINASKDPTIVALQRQHAALFSQLAKLQQQLDTMEQALRVAKSSQDTELQSLISRWKHTSREAAEEVFRNAKDKINQMGGVEAWRERSSRRPQGWEDDTENMENQEGLTDEQKEEIEDMKYEMAKDAERYGLKKTTSDSGEESGKNDDDNDTFTMEMMLKSMNIDLDVIGYDRHNQRWID